jgi:DNA-binding MarR family transcriptional regulator
MTDADIVLRAVPRILLACRARVVSDGEIRVSAHQGRILEQLDLEDPTMVTELAASMGVTPSTMSLNLKRLREAGLVVCERDPDDRRVMDVRLTEAGERAKAALQLLDVERAEEMLAGLWPEDRRRALEGLAVLADAADAMIALRGAATKPGRVSSI